MNEAPIIIIGGGHAGSEIAVALRQFGTQRPITIITEESYLPYQRPPLSKMWLTGYQDVDAIALRPKASYEAASIEILTAVRVDAIDRLRRVVHLSNGCQISYANLALAMGSRSRRLTCEGARQAECCSNFHYLRTVDDVIPLREQLKCGYRLVIVGGGYIGLELASTATKQGLDVTVIESLPQVLARVTAPVVSNFYERVHREAGVHLRTSTTVEGFEVDDAESFIQSVVIRTQAGAIERVPADVVVVGVGAVPNVELAQDAGLKVSNGIVIDKYARTSDPLIMAAGDCTCFPSSYADDFIRLESVPNAVQQARSAAAAICGQSHPHDQVPWFWSDQLDIKLQIVGLSQGHDEVVLRGRPDERSFAAFYLRAGRIIAVNTINRPKEFMIAKKLVAARVAASRRKLSDEDQDLKNLLGDSEADRR